MVENNEFKSSLAKFIDEDVKAELIDRLDLKEGNVIFIVADKERCARIMGNLRIKLGKELNLIDENKYEFCIINDFPFYEKNEDTGEMEFSHNPFSMPQGGIRNHSPKILKKAFSLVGYDEEVVRSKFPSLYEAFKYGAPPHTGMAPGIDRILMLLKDEENIREVGPFH